MLQFLVVGLSGIYNSNSHDMVKVVVVVGRVLFLLENVSFLMTFCIFFLLFFFTYNCLANICMSYLTLNMCKHAVSIKKAEIHIHIYKVL